MPHGDSFLIYNCACRCHVVVGLSYMVEPAFFTSVFDTEQL